MPKKANGSSGAGRSRKAPLTNELISQVTDLHARAEQVHERVDQLHKRAEQMHHDASEARRTAQQVNRKYKGDPSKQTTRQPNKQKRAM